MLAMTTRAFPRLQALAVLVLASAWGASAVAQPSGAEPDTADAAAEESTDAEAGAMPGPMDVDEQEQTAKAHFAVGRSLYDSGRFREAAEEWQKALEISGKPELSYNIYVAYRDASDLPRAIEALERYLQSDVEPKLRINLQARLDAMRRTIEAQQAQQAQAAAAAEPTPPPPEPEPAAPPPAQAPLQVAADDSVVPYVVMGVGGAMVVAGVVTGILASSKVDDIEAACPMDRCPADYDLDGERDSATVLVTITDILLIGGLVGIGVGATLALVAEKDSSATAAAPREPSAGLACGRDGCAVQVRGSF